MPARVAREHAQGANVERLRCPTGAVECMKGLAPVRELGRDQRSRRARWKHGFYSAEAQAQRRLTRDLVKANLEFLNRL